MGFTIAFRNIHCWGTPWATAARLDEAFFSHVIQLLIDMLCIMKRNGSWRHLNGMRVPCIYDMMCDSSMPQEMFKDCRVFLQHMEKQQDDNL